MTEITLKTGRGKPAKADLVEGEFALDVSNGTIYSKLDSGDVTALNTAEYLGVNTDADNYQYWQYKVNGFSTTNVMSTQAMDFQAGDGVEIVKKGYGIEISSTATGGGGSSVHIGENPPADPEEGQQWMEVPADGDATMWIYDGGKWLQQPGGKDGAAGKDGNIADATEQGVIATWDDTAKQWTPDGAVVVANGNVGIGTTPGNTEGFNVNSTKNIAFKDGTGSYANIFRQASSGALVLAQGYKQTETPNGFASSNGGEYAKSAISVVNGIVFYTDPISDVPEGTDVTPTERMRIGGDGRVDITGSLYVNGTPKIGHQELIKTLSTLRQATMDETQDIRESLRSAIDELVEGFEQEIATMPAGDES